MTWFQELIANCLSYSVVVLPVMLLVKFGHELQPWLRCRSRLLSSVLTWLIGGKFGPPLQYSSTQSAISQNSHDDENLRKQRLPSRYNFAILTKLASVYSTLPPKWAQIAQFMFCVIGLQVSFLTWGVLQERMVTQTYNGRRFHDSVFLVFANRCLAFVLGTVVVFFQNAHNANEIDVAITSTAPAYKYMFAAIFNIMSTWFQYEALKFVSFPLQVLSKTCKIIATMMVGRCFHSKSFTTLQYVVAISITFGVTLFVFGNESSNKPSQPSRVSYGPPMANGNHYGQPQQSENEILATGCLLLFCYLTLDSFTSNFEEQLFHLYPKLSSYHMMAGVNCWGTLLTGFRLWSQGGFSEAISFMAMSSEFTWHVLLLALSSASGSLFIYYTISSFGAVAFASIMTVRQALAILLSCIIYGHVITPLGFFGLLFVFVALGFQIATRQKKAPQHHSNKSNPPSLLAPNTSTHNNNNNNNNNLSNTARDRYVVVSLNIDDRSKVSY